MLSKERIQTAKAMKKIEIPKIAIGNYDTEKLNETFVTLTAQKIECCNWPKQFPYTPEVSFKAFHNGEKLFLQFCVTEKDIHSVIEENFGQVWTDPCVEMFISPEEGCYYNFECTCIGRMLAACHRTNAETMRMPPETLATIERYPSLGNDNFALREGETTWSMIEVIPATTLFNHKLESWEGKSMRANFYKCGDNLPHPHFLSWNKIDFERPNFHLPEFFGEVTFAK